MPPKGPPATQESVETLESTLRAEIKSLKSSLEKKVDKVDKEGSKTHKALGDLDGRITATTKKIDTVDGEWQKSVDGHVKELNNKLAAAHKTIEKAHGLIGDLQKKIKQVQDEALQETQKNAKQATEYSSSVKGELGKELQHLHGKLRALEQEHEAFRTTIQKTVADNAATQATQRQQDLDATTTKIEQIPPTVTAVQTEARVALERVETWAKEAMHEVRGDVEALTAKMKAGVDKVCADTAQEVRDKVSGLQSHLDVKHKAAMVRFDKLDEEIPKLRKEVHIVAGMPTRRVSWVVPNAMTIFDDLRAARSLFSPKFHCGGVGDLQLELRINAPSRTEAGNAGEATATQLSVPGAAPAGDPGPTDTSVFLWAPKGFHGIFRVGCGSSHRRVEHRYGERSAHGVHGLTLLNRHIRKDGSVLVYLELLESKYLKDLDVGAMPFECPPDDGTTQPLEKGGAPPIFDSDGGTSLWASRHFNNRLFEMVHDEVVSMKNRLVRRVEWRVDNAWMVRKQSPPGQAIASVPFEVAGIAEVQFQWYPNGYRTSTPGYMSLFLCAPKGTALRCVLFCGKAKRNVEHTFDESGNHLFAGRANFARFDQCVDDNGSLLIAVEILDARQEVPVMDNSPRAQLVMKRGPGALPGGGKSFPAGVNDVRELPSIWAEVPPDLPPGYVTRSGGSPDRGYRSELSRPKSLGVLPKVKPNYREGFSHTA